MEGAGLPRAGMARRTTLCWWRIFLGNGGKRCPSAFRRDTELEEVRHQAERGFADCFRRMAQSSAFCGQD